MPQAGSGHPRHAPGDTSRAHRCLAEVRLLWSAEYSLYRARESHRAKCVWQRWHAAPGRRPSKFHTCSLTWNGGAHITMDVASSRIAAGSIRAAVSREVASWWHNATASVRKLRQPGEPPEGGRRASCSLAPCRRFPGDQPPKPDGMRCHGARMMAKVPVEAVGWGLTPGSDCLSGLPINEKTGPKRICGGC
jgi:hypothetical protein